MQNEYNVKLAKIIEKGAALLKQINLRGIISGSILNHPLLHGQLNYVLFWVFVAFTYITNHYVVERKLIDAALLVKENQELRNEAITTSSELMNMSKQSEVYRRLQQMDSELEINETPPRKLKIN